MKLKKLAVQTEDITRPYGKKDPLLLYGLVSEKLTGFLKGKEIAAKNWLPNFFILKRGSKEKPLYVEDLKEITPDFLEIRKEKTLSEARNDLTPKQELLWKYFIPRKFSDFLYATNGEGQRNPLDRIFFDIDRGKKCSAEDAQKVTELLLDTMKEDEELNEIFENPRFFVSWTGSSFHVCILLEKEKPHSFYEKYFHYTKENPKTGFTGTWAEKINNSLDVEVSGGHERTPGIIIDPSQTPSGKLARVPLGSLHMKDYNTVDGISIPLKIHDLKKKGLIEKLRSYSPRKLVKDLDKLAKNLPK